jgi:2-polyprenyl-3-methyl-5-hydroxy-6-metoxy-1,4-benzoquinol methylase
MDVVERLTLEAAQADTMLACEHRHRYEFAAPLCAGERVIDLCCGSGYGSLILATHAREVVGVDNDSATVELAASTVGNEYDNVSFELADAVQFLRGDVAGQFDALVCFEGLEHLRELPEALELLRGHANHGLRIVASVPNSKLFGEDNPYHLTDFGYDEAIAAFADFPAVVMVPQYLAEGSVLVPKGASGDDVTVTLEGRDEPAYANHFLFAIGFDPAVVARVHHARLQVNASPLFNRWAEDLKKGAWALARENARLARAQLSKAGSAAASALANPSQRRITELEGRLSEAKGRIVQLEAALSGRQIAAPHVLPDDDVLAVESSLEAIAATPLAVGPDGDPNSWEMRRRRAAEYLIPWIEQTVPLAGKTVLEYGCGNAAVSCAFAERAGRVIGLDIDERWIELARDEVRKRGLTNVELELHPVDGIMDAAARRRGAVDVFLLYAVLEHLTVSERLEVLRLAREVVKPDGVIVVCETPNRLIYFDHHTARMPFFHLLPDELALEYRRLAPRGQLREELEQAQSQGGREAALDAIARWGRGVSFHEFELVFGERLDRHVIASNYDPLLFGERPVQPDEVILWRYLERWRPDLAPVFSRYWLDLILSPRPIEKRPIFLRPWSFDTTASEAVGWSASETLLLKGPEATLWVTLPQPSSRIVVGSLTRDGSWVTLYARIDGSSDVIASEHRAAGGCPAFTSFELGGPAHRIALQASRPCELVLVAFEG